MLKRFLLCFFVILALPVLFLSCGLETYAYLYPIFQSNIYTTALYTATVNIPVDNDYPGTPFTHFIILYRIYISDVSEANPQPGGYATINPALSAHYNSINYYIDTETSFSASLLQSQFINRGYMYLCFEEGEMENILSKDNNILDNRSLVFNFSYNSRPPKMTIRDNNNNPIGTYTLVRSDELDQPQPDDYLYFGNTPELRSDTYATSAYNADVERNNKAGKGPDDYAYAAMFIIAVGIDQQDYTTIYSTPNLIHAFPLPNR